MKKLIVYVFIVACFLSMAACGYQERTGEDIQERIVDRTFIYENEGFGGNFAIRINNDGTFTYYEGLLSSYIGIGTWELEENILTISDDEEFGYPFVNRFKVEDNDLIFLSENSSNFIYVKVVDGEHFTSTSDETYTSIL
jgi:predicted small secreted protein